MRVLAAITLCLVASSLAAAEPSRYARGEALLGAYLKDQVKRIEDACLTDLTTKADWEKRRPLLRQQFFEMMGLWPLPKKTDLKATTTGTAEGEGFTVERVHFQSMPGLYATGNLYLPKAKGKHPAILYVCGHANVIVDGTSYGSKAHYQYHPAWFAAHGYACLIVDTLQLGEIQGLHHGTYNQGMWWWHSRGYTPAGVELWNAIRALDYLETRPEVDAKRLGVTGRSGGGATSWWIAAADERIQAAVPVAGIADLRSHVVEGLSERLKKGVIAGHCDCMYFVNTHRWDFAMVAALIAPRPLLLGNSDADDIFPVPGYRSIAQKVSKVYALYGAEEKFQLLETQGPHKDTPELRVGINKWMNRWLRDDTKTEVKDDLPPRIEPKQLKVFDKLPADRINEKIHDTFVPAAGDELLQLVRAPAGIADGARWWTDAAKPALLNDLKKKVFAGWANDPPALGAKVADEVTRDGVRLRAIDFVSETAVPLRAFVLTAASIEKPDEVILGVIDDAGWDRWCAGLGQEFASALQLDHKSKRDAGIFAQNKQVMQSQKLAFAVIAPRGVGVTRWAAPGSRDEIQVQRRFALLGQTLAGQQVWDVRRAISAIRAQPDLKPAKLTLHGEGEATATALYAGIFEPSVAAFDLWHLPQSHGRRGAPGEPIGGSLSQTAPAFLNVLKVLDVPFAVALAAPREVTLHVARKDAAGVPAAAIAEALRKLGADAPVVVKVVGE